MDTLGPPQLDDATKQKLLQAAQTLNHCRDFLALCEKAGLECDEYKRQCEQLTTLNNGLIRTFVTPKRR